MSTILSLEIGSRQKLEEDPGLIPNVIHTQKLGRRGEKSEIKENLSLSGHQRLGCCEARCADAYDFAFYGNLSNLLSLNVTATYDFNSNVCYSS